MGDLPADLIIHGGRVVNTLTSEVIDADIAVKGERIVRVGDCSDLKATHRLDASGSYLIPGLIDSHIHTESTLMTPTHFTQVALPRGTTTIACDPHEIGNVLGIPGLELYINEARDLPLEFLVEIPSCVPAAPTLENGPNTISADEYVPLLANPDFFALAEMMNFPGVIYRDEEVMKKLSHAEKADKIREGHAPGLRGKELQAYLTAGVTSDHESYLGEEVVEKIRAGMKIQLREGSFARNLVALATAIRDEFGPSGSAWDSVIICSDDKHADTIYEEGHLDHALRLLVNSVGIDPMTAIRVCTLNPANHLRRQDLGALTAGRIANIVRVDNLTDFQVLDVISQGVHVASNHEMLVELSSHSYPEWALDTVRPKYLPPKEALFVPGPNGMDNGKAQAHVIGVIEHSLVTDHLIEEVEIRDGKVQLDEGSGLAYYFLLDRHDNTDHFARSLVRGFDFQGKVAVASTVAHDSHQLLLTGNSAAAMEFAMNKLVEAKGGQIIVEEIDGTFDFKLLPLPYAGLMSTLPPEEVAKLMTGMKQFSARVCPGISEPFMSLSFMALPVIPALKLTDLGIVDVDKFAVIDLFD
jgi:adenine deaminase